MCHQLLAQHVGELVGWGVPIGLAVGVELELLCCPGSNFKKTPWFSTFSSEVAETLLIRRLEHLLEVGRDFQPLTKFLSNQFKGFL